MLPKGSGHVELNALYGSAPPRLPIGCVIFLILVMITIFWVVAVNALLR